MRINEELMEIWPNEFCDTSFCPVLPYESLSSCASINKKRKEKEKEKRY